VTVAVITDSTACIPPELAMRYGVEVVPLHLIFAGRTFVDTITADTSEFYELLRTAPDLPTTAAPSPGMFLNAIARARLVGDSVLCITVSKQFSAMYDSARQAIELAKAETPDLDVRLFDSRNAAMAQGFVALEAARAGQLPGATLEDVMARAEAMTARVELLAMLDTLSYLARGGRVPRVAAWAAGVLQVKPIVRFQSSGVQLIARTRTRKRALDQMLESFAAACGSQSVHLAIHHANALADAEYLHKLAGARVRLAELHITEFTQVMGVHTGPGVVGLAFWLE
jgi:DegV family protein with EDD domain